MTTIIRTFFYSLLCILLGSCASVFTVQTGIPITPIHDVNPQRVLLLNTYDVAENMYRNKKEQFFMVLIDKAVLDISRDIQKRIGIETPTKLGLTKPGNSAATRDSVVMHLMREKQATDAIIITDFDVYFDQTEVVVTHDEDGSKSREARYDIISNIRYLWYDQEGLFRDEEIDVRRYHSTRSVLSGLLAFGPNIVKQQDDAYSIVQANTIRYLNLFLPGYDLRIRPVFTGKEFSAFKLAVDNNNFEKALNETLKITNHPDRKVAAKANYNAAVIYERLERYRDVKGHLQESLKLRWHDYPFAMLNDY